MTKKKYYRKNYVVSEESVAKNKYSRNNVLYLISLAAGDNVVFSDFKATILPFPEMVDK